MDYGTPCLILLFNVSISPACHFHCMQEPHSRGAAASTYVSFHCQSWQCKICTVNNFTSPLHCLLQSSSVNVIFFYYLYICSIFAFMIYTLILLYVNVSSSCSPTRKEFDIKILILYFEFQNARTDTTCPVWSLSGSEAGQDRT